MDYRVLIAAAFVALPIFAFHVGLASAQAAEPVLQDVYVGGQGGYHTYRIPALCVTTQGTVLAFCEGRKNGSGDAGDIDLLVRRSEDDGRTWQSSQLVQEEGETAEITVGNPCPIVDNASGAIHLVFTRDNGRMFYTRSEDDGKTWPDRREITDTLNDFEFPWTRVGTGPGHGLHLASGRLLVPLWLNERKGHNYRSAVIYSDDNGATWIAGGLVGTEVANTNECMAVETDTGIYLNMRARDTDRRAVTWSRDNGLTWDTPRLDDALPCPVCQAAVLGTSEGVVFSNPAGPGRTHMTVRLGSQGADKWRAVCRVTDAPSGYSDLVQLRDGTILCLFETGKDRYSERIVAARLPKEVLANVQPKE